MRPILLLATLLGAPRVAWAQLRGPLEHAGWLAGCWEERIGPRLTIEMWLPPAADMMVGGSRTTNAVSTLEFEHLRIKATGDHLVYTAIPSGQKETDFTSVRISDTLMVFENLAHDFPTRIIYRRRGADSLLARIEGPGPQGATRGVDFPMARTSCTAK